MHLLFPHSLAFDHLKMTFHKKIQTPFPDRSEPLREVGNRGRRPRQETAAGVGTRSLPDNELGKGSGVQLSSRAPSSNYRRVNSCTSVSLIPLVVGTAQSFASQTFILLFSTCAPSSLDNITT